MWRGTKMKRRISLICLAAVFAVVFALGGCNTGKNEPGGRWIPGDPPDTHGEGVIPGSGGEIQGDSKLTTYAFTPDKDGVWTFIVEPYSTVSSVNFDIYDQSDDSVPVEPVLGRGYSIYFYPLKAGNTYTAQLKLNLYTASNDTRFSLTVSPPAEIPGSGGDIYVEGVFVVYEFTPDQDGEWTFSTSGYDGGSMVLLVRDFSFNTLELAYQGVDDDKAEITIDLEKGVPYVVSIEFGTWEKSCVLAVAFGG